MSGESPRPPYDDWPVQIVAPPFGFGWYLPAVGVLVTQSTATDGTVAVVDALNDMLDRVFAEREAEYARFGGLVLLHDFRSVRRYESAARQHFADRLRSRAERFKPRRVLVALPESPLFKMAVQTVNLIQALIPGYQARTEMVTNLEKVLAELEIERPRR